MSPRQQRRQPRPLASEPTNSAAQSPYLRADHAAAYLKFGTVRSLYKAIADGLVNAANEPIPVLRRGRTLLFDQRDLDRWLHAETVTGTASNRLRNFQPRNVVAGVSR